MHNHEEQLGRRLLAHRNGSLTARVVREEIEVARYAIEEQRLCELLAKGARGAEFYAKLGKLRHAVDALHTTLASQQRGFTGGDGI